MDASKNQGFILNLNALIMDTLIDVIASIRIERKIQVFSTLFLDASKHLCKRVCPSVGPSVGPYVGRSVSRFF